MQNEENPLRRRRRPALATEFDQPASVSTEDDDHKASEGPFGKTPDGKVFRIPQTHDMLSSLFDPRLPKSQVDIFTLTLLAFQVALFLVLPRKLSQCFFLAYFALWRMAYDFGLGLVLRKQSEQRWIVRTVVKSGWMDERRRPRIRNWIVNELQAKMGVDYVFDSMPIEYNVWIMFRHFVDVILLNDFLSYCFFAVSFLQFPPNHSTIFHVLRWLGGWTLILFNLWVKVDAHRIVKDYAWYWGDTFFLSLQDLVFDGVFELAPHPMYSVGYAGYYGLSLIAASETVLFVSIAAHACQFGFLVYFENPHIERTYGQRKPIAARIPLHQKNANGQKRRSAYPSNEVPTIHTDGKDVKHNVAITSAPWSIENNANHKIHEETCPHYSSEDGCKFQRSTEQGVQELESNATAISNSQDTLQFPNSTSPGAVQLLVTRHDLDNHYFRNDLLLWTNFDIFRTRDLSCALVIIYSLCCFLLPPLSRNAQLVLAFTHALAWRVFHTIGLGLALKAQSERKWIVRHFLKHYHYEAEGSAADEAFSNWKSTYNLSLCMSYASFFGLAWHCYHVPSDWTVGSQLVRHVLGALLISLHVWTAISTFDVLGPFGWFYGKRFCCNSSCLQGKPTHYVLYVVLSRDFFIQNYPAELYYTGIFRFLNNPERSMGGAAFFGMVLICGSKLLLVQAVVSVLSQWWFLSAVENPHMQELYGKALRKDAGVTKTLRTVASRNANVLGGVSRGVQEVRGTLEKVLEETADAVENFLSLSGPRLSGYVEETKILLQQSGERFVISRVASDLALIDRSRYSLSVHLSSEVNGVGAPDALASNRYHLGEQIRLKWKAPKNHSRRDWIGVYRLAANNSTHITRVSSQGRWVGVNEHEWEGDLYDNTRVPITPCQLSDSDDSEDSGVVSFEGKRLPWKTGLYEFRYHHDGKHSVMAVVQPIEIFVDEAKDADNISEVASVLAKIIGYVLGDQNVQVHMPNQNNPQSGLTCSVHGCQSKLSEPGDFILYASIEADRIAYAIKEAFGIELASEVILAAANINKLACRISETRQLTKTQ